MGVIGGGASGICAWLLAFGGVQSIQDTIDRAEFSASPPWLTIANAHQKTADSAVLTLGDLPPGWAIATDDDGGDEDMNVDHEISEPCQQFEGQVAFSESLASSTSEKMAGPEKQSVRSLAYVFAGVDEAEDSLERERRALSSCGGDLAAVLEGALRQGLEEKGAPLDRLQLETAVEDLGSPNVGESGLMFRVRFGVTGPGGSIEIAMDFMTFRHGRMVGHLSYMSIQGLRLEDEQQIAQIAAAKLQAANASLPEA